MSYRHLDVYFLYLWGDGILKGESTPLEKSMSEWRRAMCQRPLEQRMYETDEQYIVKELEYYNSKNSV